MVNCRKQAGFDTFISTTNPSPQGDSGADENEQDISNEKPKNPQKVDDKYLKKQDVDAHEVKQEYLGKKAPIAKYDLYVDKATGRIWIYLKGGKGKPIPTDIYIK